MGEEIGMQRREFLATGCGAGIWAWTEGQRGDHAMAAELRAAEGSRPQSKAEIPTPALLVDLDAFEANLKKMAEHCRQSGVGFRPHAKTHKCPEIARRQVQSGALGICTATVPEAEAMAAAGIPGLLLTSPIVQPEKIARMVRLIQQGAKVMLSVGHPRQVELLAEAAAAESVTVDLLIDVDVGDRRTGILPGSPAVELARQIERHRGLRVRGVQAYAGSASHVVGYEARRQRSGELMSLAIQTRELLDKAGFDAGILSGGSTGTYNIDSALRGMTELQVGSYVFMDLDYRRIGGQGGEVYSDFKHSLTVLATVVSATHADRVTIDAGTKALDTTTPHRPEPMGWRGLAYGKGGDEFGILTREGGDRLPQIGQRIEFLVPHCDPTTNLYDRIYACRGEQVEDIWPVAARRERPA
jgi:D-serine deaminase-like pyridoxal phosphate-dependent protein